MTKHLTVETFPQEVFESIASNLGASDLMKLACTNSKLYAASKPLLDLHREWCREWGQPQDFNHGLSVPHIRAILYDLTNAKRIGCALSRLHIQPRKERTETLSLAAATKLWCALAPAPDRAKQEAEAQHWFNALRKGKACAMAPLLVLNMPQVRSLRIPAAFLTTSFFRRLIKRSLLSNTAAEQAAYDLASIETLEVTQQQRDCRRQAISDANLSLPVSTFLLFPRLSSLTCHCHVGYSDRMSWLPVRTRDYYLSVHPTIATRFPHLTAVNLQDGAFMPALRLFFEGASRFRALRDLTYAGPLVSTRCVTRCQAITRPTDRPAAFPYVHKQHTMDIPAVDGSAAGYPSYSVPPLLQFRRMIEEPGPWLGLATLTLHDVIVPCLGTFLTRILPRLKRLTGLRAFTATVVAGDVAPPLPIYPLPLCLSASFPPHLDTFDLGVFCYWKGIWLIDAMLGGLVDGLRLHAHPALRQLRLRVDHCERRTLSRSESAYPVDLALRGRGVAFRPLSRNPDSPCWQKASEGASKEDVVLQFTKGTRDSYYLLLRNGEVKQPILAAARWDVWKHWRTLKGRVPERMLRRMRAEICLDV